MENFKIKQLTKEQILICADRLTRFKPTEAKYIRVFFDLITAYLINPKYKKNDLEKMDYKELTQIAQNIINYSLENLIRENNCDFSINEKLKQYEKSVFKFDNKVETLLENKINYKGLIKLIPAQAPQNLKWLKTLEQNTNSATVRQKEGFKFPLEKILIVEGATEEVLLPVFAKLCGFDFDKNGIHILSAGGKNQVVKYYYRLAEDLKLPIFILLDKDAQDNLEEIKLKLRTIDKFHILKCGEFEDLLPTALIKRTLKGEIDNISILDNEIFTQELSKAKILEEIFKTRGMHEFKKVEFANMVKKYIKNKNDISPEIKQIIDEVGKK